MIIALESEIVATRYDPQTRTCFYTLERDGKRWTAAIPLTHFEQMGHSVGTNHPPSKQQRRDHVATTLVNAMRGPADEP